jgi:hypothetical protein
MEKDEILVRVRAHLRKDFEQIPPGILFRKISLAHLQAITEVSMLRDAKVFFTEARAYHKVFENENFLKM